MIEVDKYQPKNVVNGKKDTRGILEKIFELKAIPVSLFTALTALGYVSILSFYRLYVVEVDLVDAFSWFFIIYSICLVISRPLAGRIQDRCGDMIICVTGIIAQSAGIFLIAVVLSNLTVFVCAVCLALGFGTLNSACTAIVTRNSSETEDHTLYQCFSFFVMQLWVLVQLCSDFSYLQLQAMRLCML